MARATFELVSALRTTIVRLRGDARYQWGHMGMCNCGHLAQSITGLDRARIHESALVREGDWEAQAQYYCPDSGLPIDDIIGAMLDLGMTREDIRHLEKLSDPGVLRRLPPGRRHLRRNQRDDVILYMEAWAELLEASLPARVAAA